MPEMEEGADCARRCAELGQKVWSLNFQEIFFMIFSSVVFEEWVINVISVTLIGLITE